MILWDNTKQTVELRSIVESGVNIWDFDYPSFYQGEEKKRFEKKVIDHLNPLLHIDESRCKIKY